MPAVDLQASKPLTGFLPLRSLAPHPSEEEDLFTPFSDIVFVEVFHPIYPPGVVCSALGLHTSMVKENLQLLCKRSKDQTGVTPAVAAQVSKGFTPNLELRWQSQFFQQGFLVQFFDLGPVKGGFLDIFTISFRISCLPGV